MQCLLSVHSSEIAQGTLCTRYYAPRPGDNDRLDVVGVAQFAERVAQLGIAVESQWIFAVRPAEGDGGDLAVDRPVEMLGLKVAALLRAHRVLL